MANIVINNYCNLRCPYCFANKYITEEEKQSITTDQLSRILTFLSKTNVNSVGIIGGEPTIHPNFLFILSQVVGFCKNHDAQCIVYSNGIHLGEFAWFFKDKVKCLMNVNHPDIVGDRNWNSIINSLDRIDKFGNINNITLGVNLYRTLDDYEFIFELANKYNRKTIRVSYAAPTCEFSNFGKEDYYNEAKEIFLPFASRAKDNGVGIDLDCNHIPRCYFNDKELAMLDKVITNGFNDYCDPVVDITPDFKCTACFGAYELFDLKNFENIYQVERFLSLKKMYPLAEGNLADKCIGCPKHENLSCQGGCLAFANK